MKKTWVLAALALLASAQASAQQRGDWALARWNGGDYWFPGVVESIAGNQATIAYDDGTRETLPLHMMRPYDWGVGTRVECRWQGGQDWYAGHIVGVSRDGTTLHVEYEDGDREQTRTSACRS